MRCLAPVLLSMCVLPQAQAQNAVDNVAYLSQPAGFTCTDAASNPTCQRTDNALVQVDPPTADLRVSKTDGRTDYTTGATLDYVIVVENIGPDAADGAILTDPAIAGLTVNSVSCTAAGGAVCPASLLVSDLQGGGLTIPVLPVNGSVTFQLSATATAAGDDLTNTATVALPAGMVDPTPADNSASDTDIFTATADLQITKDDGRATYTTGSAHTYTLVVRNIGPNTVTDAILTDPAVAGLTVSTVTCTPSGAALCPTSLAVADLQAGGLVIPSLPVGDSLSFQLSAQATATGGDLTNTATIAPPAGVIDPTPGDNSASDTNTFSRVTVAKTSVTPAPGASVEAGQTITYRLTFEVSGGESARAETATDQPGAGLTFDALGTISNPTYLGCTGTPLACTLQQGAPVGQYTVEYTATVDAGATGSVSNAVTGVTCATADGCAVTHPLSTTTVGKTANPASGASVEVGDTIDYTLTFTVAGGATTAVKRATDTLGAGLTLGAVTPDASGRITCNGANPLECELAAGTPVGTYTVTYRATIAADAPGTVSNNVTGLPCAGSCTTTHLLSAVAVGKTANPASGASVEVGDTIDYTLTFTVAGGATTEIKRATDTLGAGLTLGAVTPDASGRITCNNANPLECELAAGTPNGTYTVTYQATVAAGASGTVTNNVTGLPCAGSCTTTHHLSDVTVGKSSNPASGGSVEVGDTIDYTLTFTVAGGATTEIKRATDTLGAGLTLGAVTPDASGRITCNSANPLECELAAGTPAGTYTVTYQATVAAGASGTVTNNVTGLPCAGSCTTTHNLSAVTVGKSSNPASGASVEVGDTIDYTLTFTVAGGATTEIKRATDTLGAGLTLGTVTPDASGRITCNSANPLECELAAGTPAGTYTVTYQATVATGASGTVTNTVAGLPCAGSCSTSHSLSSVTVAKSASPGNGVAVEAGDTLTYTLTFQVSGGATTQAKTANDQLGAGLSFGAIGTISDPAWLSCSGGAPMGCTLAAGAPIGTYTVEYTATVDADASGSVSNTVSGVACASAGACGTTHPISTVTVAKSANPGSGTSVEAGDTIEYTLTFTVAGGASTEAKVATDQPGPGLVFGAVGAISDPSRLSCAGTPMACTLAAGAPVGTYTVRYTATVAADASGSVSNTVTGVACAAGGSCDTTHPISTVSVAKSATPANGASVEAGDTIEYTLAFTVAGGASTQAKTATDTLGAGLTFAAVGVISDPSRLSCTAGSPMTCTLAAGTPAGTYTVRYTATVDADASGAVTNTVAGVPCTATGGCGTSHTVSAVTLAKSSLPASGSSVEAGDTITYTLTYTVTGGASPEAKVATDQLGPGLAFGAVGTIRDPARLSCTGGAPMICTLAAGAPAGTYTVEYTATVSADASGSVSNTVSGVACASVGACGTTHPLSTVSVAKSANPASGVAVRIGDTLTYTLTFTVAGGASTQAKTATDTLGTGLAFGAVTAISDAALLSCTGASPLACTLAAGAPVGTYTVAYTATVAEDAVGTVTNSVAGMPCATEGGCATTHPLLARVDVMKSATPAAGTEVRVGDAIEYTLTATVAQGTTTEPVRLLDTPGPGLTVGALPAGCAMQAARIACMLEAGAAPGVYTFAYTATVSASASGNVGNTVVSDYRGSSIDVICQTCATVHQVAERPQLRVVKTAGVREARIGDLVRYTVTVENVGAIDLRNGQLIDTPPAGFTYVDGSLSVIDGDNAATASGRHPIRFEGLDIAAGQSATLAYLMRIGAGVRPGTMSNQAQARDAGGTPISNIATAELIVATDPLLDDSLIFGTVFDDRDGDRWQDSAALTGVRVRGGFDEAAYIAGSTTIDRGDGPQPLADASAPLLHGVEVGAIAGRQSEADPGRRTVIRQRLREPRFGDDFVLTSDQGVTVRMDAGGRTTTEKHGEAAKGLNAAAPTVERRVAQGEDGLVVDYVIGNEGIDERGLPGVRIASVEGLLIETDPFGRYHLAGLPGGAWERGRNFILKVDPATLPAGTEITTDNPLIRRITPGVPVRFDFGARLPAGLIEGGTRQVELELGEVVFAPGDATVSERYAPVIDRVAGKLEEYQGGEVVIAANGDNQALAFDRAAAVKDALMQRLPAALAEQVDVVVRTTVDDPDSLVAGVGEGGPLLGTVLFDTDRADVRPEFAPLLDRVAAHLERLQGGTVAIVGHADLRGSDGYNLDLGLRRARAVYEALAQRLPPELRKRVWVEPTNAMPAGAGRKSGSTP